MAEHTKTPWELRGAATLRGADGDYVATIENNGRRAANAAFIVRAVNCHDDLVSAIEATRALVSECAKHGFVGDSPLTELFTNNARLTSALAKARGETA